MIKHKQVFGVDISKDFFDVVSSEGTHNQFTNNTKGFGDFCEELPKRALVVMESTGYYHHRLAQYLVSKKVKTSVVNPLAVKRFRQMKLSRIKTDKADAGMICEYARQNEVPRYKAKSKRQIEASQLLTLAGLYQKQQASLKTKLKGEIAMGSPSLSVVRSIKRQLRTLLSEILSLEKELGGIVAKAHPNKHKLLTDIPGIGNKTATYLLVATDGFQKFDNARQLCCFSGITPSIRQSGSSIRGKSRISKVGDPKIRKLLFLCSFSASKYNAQCSALFDRIVAKGKSKKLALIAVANKLLRQAFTIGTSQVPYNSTHYSIRYKPC